MRVGSKPYSTYKLKRNFNLNTSILTYSLKGYLEKMNAANDLGESMVSTQI